MIQQFDQVVINNKTKHNVSPLAPKKNTYRHI